MKPLSILVVDDDDATRRVLQMWLKVHGHSVLEAACGKEAIRLVGDSHVDLVITDVLMPDGNGIELIEKLKRTLPTLKVLAISGGGPHVSSSSCLQRAHRAGARALLLKPFHPDQLEAAMHHVLEADDAKPAVDHHRHALRTFVGMAVDQTKSRALGRSREG